MYKDTMKINSFPIFPLGIIILILSALTAYANGGIVARNEPVLDMPLSAPIAQGTFVQVDFSHPKTIYYKGKKPITTDYERGVIISKGKEIPIIVDGDVKVESPLVNPEAWTIINYNRFDIYVDSAFYSANQAALDNLFNNFSLRYGLMEQQTNWSSERFYGIKLKIYINQSGSSCVSGWAIPGEAHVQLTSFFSNPAACKKEYIENGVLLLNNPGQLEDYWIYTSGLLHESLHSINPYPIYSRRWMTEGFSEYYMFNILSNYNGNGFLDINQETSDYYIYNGNFSTTTGNWNYYASHDYKDKSNNPIQSSAGYDISAWMVSMMRDNHNMNWNEFYRLLNNNIETLDKSEILGTSYTDSFVLDIVGRASGLTFPQTQVIWRYDGPSGPGWGVRNWEPLDWYADLSPSLSFSKTNPYVGESVNLIATVHNYGQTSSTNVSVRFYNGISLLNEQSVNVVAGGNTVVSFPFTSNTAVTYNINIKVDEANIKIETDDSNNSDSGNITFSERPPAPSCWFDKRTGMMKCA